MAQAYAAGDGFLPSWGPGMRPLEPHDQRSDSSKVLKNALKSKSAEYRDEKASLRAGELPLYGSSAGNLKKGTSSSHKSNDGAKSLCLMLLPTFSGVLILCLFNFAYRNQSALCWGVFYGCTFLGLMMVLIGWQGGLPAHDVGGYSSSGYSSVFMKTTGGCIVFISALGMLLGYIGYSVYMRNYDVFNASVAYDSVPANSNPSAYTDAGSITFSADARIDPYKAAAYRKGVTYCAAPIIGSDPSGFVGFWAVGTGCCGKTAFRCGDVYGDTHGGRVVRDADPEYMKAAEESAARAGLALPVNPIFIAWSSTISAEVDSFHHNSVIFAIGASIGIFVLMLCVVGGCNFVRANQLSNGGLVDKFYSGINFNDPSEKLSDQRRFTGHAERLRQNPSTGNEFMVDTVWNSMESPRQH